MASALRYGYVRAYIYMASAFKGLILLLDTAKSTHVHTSIPSNNFINGGSASYLINIFYNGGSTSFILWVESDVFT